MTAGTDPTGTHPAVDAAGVEHLGCLYDPATGLATGVLPLVRAALDAGRPVSVLVERDEAEALQRALPDTAALRVTAPSQVLTTDTGLLEHLDRVAGEGPALVLAQYSVFEMGDAALRHTEEQINQLASEWPLTLICACSARERAARLVTARATHPHLLHHGVPGVNPAYRQPGTPLEVDHGAHILSLTFRGRPDLHHLRRQVRAAATAAGLEPSRTETWVIAIHEAAVIVSEAAAPDDLEPCELDVWSAEATLTAELRGPRGSAAATAEPPGEEFPPPATGAPDPLAAVRLFCRDATSFTDRDSRIVRLLASRHPEHGAVPDQ